MNKENCALKLVEVYNVMVNSEELNGITECLAL